MNDLGNDARALLELARDAHDPDEHDRARVRARLASRLGVAAGLGVVAGLGAAAKTTAAAGAGAGAGSGAGAGIAAGTLGAGAGALKLIGAALIVSATVGVGAVAVQQARRAPVQRVAVTEKASLPSPRRSATSAAAVSSAAPPEAGPSEAPVPASERHQQSPKTNLSPARPTVASVTKDLAPAPAPASKKELADAKDEPAALAAKRSAPAVADEASLFHQGIVALRSGQPARALELFELHAHLYPQGVLAEERDAERAWALADLGRIAEARSAIEQFLQRHPVSPLSARLLARARQLDADDAKASPTD